MMRTSIDMKDTLPRLAAALLLVFASLAGVSAASAAISAQPAQLAIEQPDYINKDVVTQTQNGTTVYVTQSGNLEIKPQNFNTSDVRGYGVETNAGSLSYDEQFDVFRFNNDGHTGTFKLYWEVDERRTVGEGNNSSVETVRTRYTAVLKVESNSSYVHLQQDQYEQEKRDAENWSAYSSSILKISGEDADIGEKAQLALDLLQLREHPLSALSGDFTGILLMMVMTIGGGLVLALFGALHLGARYTDIKALNRWNSLKSDERALDEKWADLQLSERKRILQNMDWNDIFEDDERARAWRDTFGETVYDGVCRFQSMLLPDNIVSDRLQAMGQNGYVGLVERADVRTDGGDTESAPIVSADVVRERDLDDDTDKETFDLTSPGGEFDDFMDAFDRENDEFLSFDLSRADIDHNQLVSKCRLMDIEELMEEMDAQRLDFEDPDEFGKLLREFILSVRQSDYTDDHGTPDDYRFVMNQFLQVSQIMSDKQRIPLFEFSAQAVERALADRSPVEEAESTVDAIQQGRYS